MATKAKKAKAKAKKTKTKTSRLTKELLETARDMLASGLLTKTAHDKITMRQVGVAQYTLGPAYLFAASFVWRCLSGRTVVLFPHSPHRTGLAPLAHPALGQALMPSPTAGCASAPAIGPASGSRRGIGQGSV